mmetsp:Transcript_19645/g.21735  ORF Transcript_19645/g.21735 Transcript_19645/m.21735 type:complete len:207 (-) Transcript_19645:134-754(-)
MCYDDAAVFLSLFFIRGSPSTPWSSRRQCHYHRPRHYSPTHEPRVPCARYDYCHSHTIHSRSVYHQTTKPKNCDYCVSCCSDYYYDYHHFRSIFSPRIITRTRILLYCCCCYRLGRLSIVVADCPEISLESRQRRHPSLIKNHSPLDVRHPTVDILNHRPTVEGHPNTVVHYRPNWSYISNHTRWGNTSSITQKTLFHLSVNHGNL